MDTSKALINDLAKTRSLSMFLYALRWNLTDPEADTKSLPY